jgi:peptide/nickel transport system substrate-binding protein
VTRIAPVPILEYIEPMTRPEYAKPSNGMPQLAVRQAMMFGIDRTALTEAITLGLGPVADTHWFPYDALYPQLESAAFKYPYDPDRAKQLLAQAGWEPGADGVLVHRPSGERFETEVMVNQTLPVKVGDILAADWKQLGIVAAVNPISPARSTDRAYQAQRPGPYATYAFGTPPWSSYRLYGKELASEANRWSGRNRVGYQNPRSDAVLEQLLQTVDPAQRLPLLREQVQIYTTDAALMPLYWEVRTALMLQSVKADIQPFLPYWNAFSWDKEAS